jgi:hypothetical protein
MQELTKIVLLKSVLTIYSNHYYVNQRRIAHKLTCEQNEVIFRTGQSSLHSSFCDFFSTERQA